MPHHRVAVEFLGIWRKLLTSSRGPGQSGLAKAHTRLSADVGRLERWKTATLATRSELLDADAVEDHACRLPASRDLHLEDLTVSRAGSFYEG